MKPRPSRVFLVSAVAILAICAVVAVAWKRGEKNRRLPRTPEERAETRREVDATMARLIAEYPVLAVEKRDVRPEENGFLQLYLLSEENDGEGPVVTPELRAMVGYPAPEFDLEKVEKALEENAELVARVEAIADLPGRSSLDMPEDYVGFISGRAMKRTGDILLSKARVAAAKGDESESLQAVERVRHLAAHLREVETPNFFSETLALVFDRGAFDMAFSEILPTLGGNSDLAAWRRVLQPPDVSPTALARVVRGEWHAGKFLLLPMILDPNPPEPLSDPDALAQAVAAGFAETTAELPRLTLREMAEGKALDNLVADHRLSRGSRKIAEIWGEGNGLWLKGYVRMATQFAQFEAALQLLEWERQGKELDAATLKALPVDPVMEAPFIFDPATRTVRAPYHRDLDIPEPLKLPW